MVGIVILNYNNCSDIFKCIDSVVEHTPLQEVKFVVVDNGSTGSIKERVGDYLSHKFNMSYEEMKQSSKPCTNKSLKTMTYLCLDNNLGYANGNNEGIKILLNDSSIGKIMILNSDIIFVENIIPSLSNLLSNTPLVGAVSPLLRKPNGDIEHCCARKALKSKDYLLTFSYLFSDKYRLALKGRMILKNTPSLLNNDIVDIELPSGSCMMFNTEVLRDIEGFDTHTFLYYEEDILYKKLKAKGYRNLLVPSLNCIHIGGATTNNTKTAFFLRYCNYKSLLYYLKQYEDVSSFELLLFKIRANIRLIRPWLGLGYKKIKSFFLVKMKELLVITK